MPVRALIITPLIYIRITNSVERNSFEIGNIYIRVHISNIGYFFLRFLSSSNQNFLSLCINRRQILEFLNYL